MEAMKINRVRRKRGIAEKKRKEQKSALYSLWLIKKSINTPLLKDNLGSLIVQLLHQL
jgi:hypothetical protein